MSTTPPPSYSKLFPKNTSQSSHQTRSNFSPNDIPNERSYLLSPPPSSTTTLNYYHTVVNIVFSGPVLGTFLAILLVAKLLSIPIVLYQEECARAIARQQAGVVWGSPESLCIQYGERSYSAKLLNYSVDEYWQEACERTPLVMRGKKIRKTCQVVRNEVVGHWQSNDVASGCRPFWGPVEHEYCSGSNKVISSRLMHLESDMRWEVMCQTTPFRINEMSKFLMSCENKGIDGVWGYLTLDNDEGCIAQEKIKQAQERIRQREEAGVTWSVPQPGPCLQYSVQEYSTVLLHYDVDKYWNEACETIELVFNDQRLKSPDKCEILQNVHNKPQVIGYWHIMGDSPDCTPYWISISNEHCVGTHKRMVSARLWNIKDSNQWDLMCRTAPLTLQNVSRVPLSCENKGMWGIWGHWEIVDETCEMLV